LPVSRQNGKGRAGTAALRSGEVSAFCPRPTCECARELLLCCIHLEARATKRKPPIPAANRIAITKSPGCRPKTRSGLRAIRNGVCPGSQFRESHRNLKEGRQKKSEIERSPFWVGFALKTWG